MSFSILFRVSESTAIADSAGLIEILWPDFFLRQSRLILPANIFFQSSDFNLSGKNAINNRLRMFLVESKKACGKLKVGKPTPTILIKHKSRLSSPRRQPRIKPGCDDNALFFDG